MVVKWLPSSSRVTTLTNFVISLKLVYYELYVYVFNLVFLYENKARTGPS